MTTNIKITQLTDIGANLNINSLVPVVNMSGAPVTQKANLQIVGNLILNYAGNGFPSANSAIFSQSVTNAAQPNITSVGTLTSLTVAGNVNLGAIGNVRITGGSIGQVLTTDGAGNLSWANDGTSYSNSNVALYLPTYTGNLSGNVITANRFSGEAGNLSNITGGNVSGNVPFANVAYSVAAGNIVGTVANANYAHAAEFSNTVFVEPVNNNFSYHVVLTTGPDDYTLHNDIDDNFQYNPADGILTVTRLDASYIVGNLAFANGLPAANVTGLGNVVSVNFDGNSSNVLRGNGIFASVPGLGNVGSLSLNGNGQTYLAGNGTFSTVAFNSTTPITYSALPTPAAGLRAFITDANLVPAGNFGAQVSGSGSNLTPIWCDGTNWYIG